MLCGCEHEAKRGISVNPHQGVRPAAWNGRCARRKVSLRAIMVGNVTPYRRKSRRPHGHAVDRSGHVVDGEIDQAIPPEDGHEGSPLGAQSRIGFV